MKSPRSSKIFFALLSISVAVSNGTAQDLIVTPDHSDGVYQPGEQIRWKIEWKGDSPATEATYTIKQNGQTETAKGTVPLTDNTGTLDAKLDQPGSLLIDVKVTSADDKPHKALGGALTAPDKITPASPRPDDFDNFWAAKLKELSAIPPNAQLEPADSGKANVDYWKITLDNVNGTQIHGQLARPKNGDKFPALLIPQWAGVYPLQKSWVTDRAAEGWLVLNIEAHDMPIDEPESYYKDLSAGSLKDYWALGNDDRDTSYFLRMYLSCYQAAEYLTSRPDWNEKTLVVSGGSQGGMQSLMLAGLHPKITAAVVLVPAGCDLLGPLAGRAPGWPAWYSQLHGKDAEKVRQAARYYDVENFASHIKCPVLVAVGLVDQVCPPAATFAAFNQIHSPKEILIMPQSDHQDSHGSQRAYYQLSSKWLAQLRRGEQPPLKDQSASAPPTNSSSANSAAPAIPSNEILSPSRETYLKLAAETEAALKRNDLECWFPRCIDNDHGGYYCNFARDWKPTKSEGKFSVFQGRMAWVTAEVALRRPEYKDQYLPYTRHGAKFFADVMWDNQDGGIYWRLNDDGKIPPGVNSDKQLYGIGFGLYALANSYRATQDPATLELAQRIFRWVDQHAHDDQHGGYFEWLSRDGTPIQPDPNKKQPELRDGLPVGGKSMNTHIHYLEALTELYKVWPDAAVRDRLEDVLAMVRDKVCREPGVMNLYFTFDWQPTSDRDSYGHNIETAYLLTEAAEALGVDDPKTARMARMLVDHGLEVGWDTTNGGVYREGPMGGKPDDLIKEWWQQFESLNAFLLMHEKYAHETDKYFKAFQQQWNFIKNFQIDHEYPGVIEQVTSEGKPITKDKGRMWKAAYHDGRALMNVSDRLKKLADKGNNDQSNSAIPGFIKGYTWGWVGTRGQYTGPGAATSMKRLAETGAQWVCIAFGASMKTSTTPEIRWGDKYDNMVTDDEIRHAIDLARENGMKVILKPVVNPDDGVWRAEIKFTKPDPNEASSADKATNSSGDATAKKPAPPKQVKDLDAWNRWWQDYSAFIVHYAKLAEEKHVEIYCLGCEMNSTEEFVDQWRKLIADVRKVYTGLLTYDVNHDSEDNVHWWDAVDFISISAYYAVRPANNRPMDEAIKETTPVSEIVAGLDRIKKRLAKISAKWQKPILFIETGVINARGFARYPWSHSDEHPDSPIDEQEQANFYEAMCQAFWNELWFMGFTWWEWPAQLPDANRTADSRTFSVDGKQGEAVMRQWYAKPAHDVATPPAK